jgi:hypothetical protein
VRNRTTSEFGLRLEVDVGGPLLGGLEDDRVDEPDERGVGDSVLGLEVVAGLVLFLGGQLLLFDLEHGARAECLCGSGEALDLVDDVFLRGHAELDRETGRELQLVDRVHVLRVGDRHAKNARFDGVGDRDQPLEDVERDFLGGVGRDTGADEIDDRQGEARRERVGDPLRRREALVDERLREGTRLRSRAGERHVRGRQQAGLLDDICDELRDGIDREGRPKRARTGGPVLLRRRSPQLSWPFQLHNPNEVVGIAAPFLERNRGLGARASGG